MDNLPSIIGLALFLAVAFLAVAAILMPVVVIIIDSRLAKVAKTLAAMEHMMRHGK